MNNTAKLALPVTPSSGSLVRARWSTRVQFASLGELFPEPGGRTPSIKQHFALTEVSLSVVLLFVALGAFR